MPKAYLNASAGKEAARSGPHAGAGRLVGDAAQPDQAHMDKGLISSKGSTGPKRALLEDAELMGAAGGDLFGRDLLGDTSYEDGVQMLLGIVDENGPGRVSASIKTCYVSCTIRLLLQLFMSVADLLLGAPVMGMGRGSYAGHAGWRLLFGVPDFNVP